MNAKSPFGNDRTLFDIFPIQDGLEVAQPVSAGLPETAPDAFGNSANAGSEDAPKPGAVVLLQGFDQLSYMAFGASGPATSDGESFGVDPDGRDEASADVHLSFEGRHTDQSGGPQLPQIGPMAGSTTGASTGHSIGSSDFRGFAPPAPTVSLIGTHVGLADAAHRDDSEQALAPDSDRSGSATSLTPSGSASAAAANASLPTFADVDPEIAFISGVSGLTVAGTSFGAWDDTSSFPANYETQSDAFKWGASHEAGTPGGTIHYFFKATSNWTADEKHGLEAGLALWAAEANVSFQEVNTAAAADFSFIRGTTRKANTDIPHTQADVGSLDLGTPSAGGRIKIDTSGPTGFGPILDPGTSTAFARYGGYVYDTIVHEEGHMLGLGHGGPYDAGDGLGTPEARQFSQFDMRLWSIMSYIEPDAAAASFFKSYDVKGTNWGDYKELNGNSYNVDPTTPMLLDILAIQRLYGAPTSGPLVNGGHHFGFNCNITGYVGDFFNFEINKTPVVTIWCTGSNNTLDLSGWNTRATIDLTPGGFCSADGMKNNIGIASVLQIAHGGGGNDSIHGNYDANKLYGEDGSDTIDGGEAHDYLAGGAGNDRYILYDVSGGVYDYTAEFSGTLGGIDLVYVQPVAGGPSSYTLEANVENGSIIGAGNGFTLNGNTQDNKLYADRGSNSLNGLNGNDRLEGGSGADTLDGGAGSDTMSGNAGNDLYYLADVSGGQYDTVIEAAGHGVDMVLVRDVSSSVRSYTMTANVEDGAIIGHEASGFTLNGNDKANHLFDDIGGNTLSGGDGRDSLDGGDGLDFLEGGSGNDSYYLNDRPGDYDLVSEAANGGYDYVFVKPIHIDGNLDQYLMYGNVEYAELLGTIDFNLFANGSNNNLHGNAGANLIFGYGGNDKLSGHGGDDTLRGGEGDDAYFLEDLIPGNGITLSHYDTVIEGANGGTDQVFVLAIDDPSSFSEGYTLEANVENGTITGSLAFELDGNELDNVLTGNSGANTLQGLDGNDTLIGGTGADVLDGGIGNNTASYANATTGLFAGLEDTNANSGDAAGDSYISIENIIGSAHNDTIYGDGGNNRFDGGEGDDLFVGKGGADTFNGGGGNDTVAYDSSYGLRADLSNPGTNTGDAIGDIYIAIENLEGSTFNDTIFGNDENNYLGGNHYHDGASGQDQLFGRGGNDTLSGYDDNDSLDGGAGNDWLVGGTGQDSLTGGADSDTFAFTQVEESGDTAATADTIADFTHAVDRIDVHAIDANTAVAGNQDFTFGGAFTAGHIQAVQSGADTVVNFNTDSDATAEMSILLKNFTASTLTGADFVF